MYQISDRQYDFIISDIRARGVEMESLQEDLADHICCIIEKKFEEGGNFEQLYNSVIETFYKKDLTEIEEETQMLLNNKNYYIMKKVMIVTGIVSAGALTAGILLKFLHLPGAAAGIVSGITLFSLLFLPLMVVLKIKEKNNFRDKALATIGTAVAILISMATMFKIMHWPYANMMGMIGVGMLFILYLPVNLVTGIRNPDTKVNTIVSSILLIAGCGLFLSLVRSPQGSLKHYRQQTAEFVRFKQIVDHETKTMKDHSGGFLFSEKAGDVFNTCDDLIDYILERETGNAEIDMNFMNDQVIGDNYLYTVISPESRGNRDIQKLKEQLTAYNSNLLGSKLMISPESLPLFDLKNVKTKTALTDLIQLKLMIIQNERS